MLGSVPPQHWHSSLGVGYGVRLVDIRHIFGGGVIATSMKHSHMDRAAALAREADARLAEFSGELADVTGEQRTGDSLEMEGGLRFMDMWFDNMFADFSVRDRIDEARDKAARASAGIDEGLHKCDRRSTELRSRLTALSSQRQSLIGDG